MTAKQELLEFVETLTEREAADSLGLLRSDLAPPPLTPNQIDEVRQALASLDAGRKTSHEDAMKRLGLA